MADERPRPSPRPRRTEAAADRPSPRPRVAGARRERPVPAVPADEPRRHGIALPVALLVLVLAVAAGAGLLLWQRLDPPTVDASVLAATQEDVEALYAYDYRDSDGSVQGKLDVLTGDLREQYASDLESGGIIDTYEQVSATTRYEVLDVALKTINRAQDSATVVVFGSYVIESVTSGDKPAPEGSGCQVTPEGAQSCTQTLRLDVVKADGEWKIADYAVLTTS